MLIVLCAEESEAKHIKCKRANIFVTGVGLVNILQSPLKFPPNAKIVNVGYAGSNVHPIGTVLSVNRVERFIKSSILNEPVFNLTPCYVDDSCYTADDFITYTLILNDKIPLIDMELYYLAARYPNIESIKIVSDNLNLEDHRNVDLSESWELVNKILNQL